MSEETERCWLARGSRATWRSWAAWRRRSGWRSSGVLEQDRRDGAGYIGRGKREELRELVAEVGARFVIADDELTASQARVLERACGRLGRGQDGVDHPHLRGARGGRGEPPGGGARGPGVPAAEGQGQEPRAQPPRAAAGVTPRGPGEQQLEYDRRVIRERIATINRKLEGREGRQGACAARA